MQSTMVMFRCRHLHLVAWLVVHALNCCVQTFDRILPSMVHRQTLALQSPPAQKKKSKNRIKVEEEKKNRQHIRDEAKENNAPTQNKNEIDCFIWIRFRIKTIHLMRVSKRINERDAHKNDRSSERSIETVCSVCVCACEQEKSQSSNDDT